MILTVYVAILKLDLNILQHFLFFVSRKKETHTGFLKGSNQPFCPDQSFSHSSTISLDTLNTDGDLRQDTSPSVFE